LRLRILPLMEDERTFGNAWCTCAWNVIVNNFMPERVVGAR
jgi:hypothetical protein